jgi:hypothetical protein
MLAAPRSDLDPTSVQTVSGGRDSIPRVPVRGVSIRRGHVGKIAGFLRGVRIDIGRIARKEKF